MTNRPLVAASGAFALLFAAGQAEAAIVTFVGQPGAVHPTENVLFPNTAPTDGLVTFTDHHTSVTFTSADALSPLAGGNAGLKAITFALTDPGQGMSTIEFLLTDPEGQHANATIDFYDQNNAITSISNFTLGNGNDLFAAATDGGTVISKVVITFAGNINDMRPVRLTPAALAPVPEPAVWAMLIGGFAMVGIAGRRRGAATLAS